MNFEKTGLPGVWLIKPYIFEDFRGEFVEMYNEKLFAEHGITTKFVQDDISLSSKGTLRGIHGDENTVKLVSCMVGRMYLVVVDCDEKSPNFGKWISFTLTEKSRHLVYVPPKHGVGHLALTDRIILNYKQSAYYDSKGQFTYKWDDPRFKIWWPIKNPTLSQRDESGHYV
ncbi:dTDP-4-keto-6-deoxy-D-glucose epimerase [bacterium]|nr:MAG: dTDP-4-keto-6-deoxy-D-glucose epimerase [bacterium]